MSSDSVWIVGAPLSGKTTNLLHQLRQWGSTATKPFLIFAATGDNRLELCDRIETQFSGQIDSRTPLGFFQDEVLLFWPLLAQQLDLKVQFPLRLRPETEQELATRLWRSHLDSGRLRQDGISEYFIVRRTLDLLQLAATSGTPLEDLPFMLQDGYAEEPPELWHCMGEALSQWRQWCLDRGLLSYGITTDLYWRNLLPHPTYQHHLRNRYQAILADDVDEYPAIARTLFEFLLDQGLPGAFTYNPEGGIRLGLGADPQHLGGLADRCQTKMLPPAPQSLGTRWGTAVSEWINDPIFLPDLPPEIQTIQATSRAQLLRQTAEMIADAVQSGQVQPQEIAVVGAGVDAIARYTLREILARRGIAVHSLNDQRPLIGSPPIRALLTLMALVYPSLGRLLDRDDIAELLVILTQSSEQIDPVRAGLLTDYCFAPDLDRPRLLPATTFPRWDRLGFEAVQAYSNLVQWIEAQQTQQQQHLLPSPVILLDRAIQRFFWGSDLPFDQLAALRELMETAQHYWDVDARLHRYSHTEMPAAISVGNFIRLLRDGTLTADPFPVRRLDTSPPAVMIATIYQYRSNRQQHRWHFWLDVGSAFWLTGGGALFGAPLLLRNWSGRAWTAADSLQADQQRLQRQVTDLLARVSDRVYLCHSELATNGQEQTGPLLSLANAATLLEEMSEIT